MPYPWQKVYEQHPTITVSKVIEEAPALQGFNGSWAASYTNGYVAQSDLAATEPGNAPARVNKIGQPGLPEINFAPYCANTNRFGLKGPSLIGHPISYSVVGPTLKSQFCDWQWVATDNSAFPGTGDTITYDAARGVFGGAPTLPNIRRAYNIFDLTPYPNGLYLVISQTGEVGVLPNGSTPGGLGDGFYNDIGNTAITAKDPTSKFEIFRIESIDAGQTYFTLSPDKRLKDYFDFPLATPETGTIRAILLFEPKAARLMGVPDSSAAGREQVFVSCPPETAATSDLLPPFGIDTQPGTWAGGQVDPFDLTSLQKGGGSTFSDGAKTPIPLPLGNRIARAESRVIGVVPAPLAIASVPLGTFTLIGLDGLAVLADVGKILRIYKSETTGNVVLLPSPSDAHPPATSDVFFGWYEILGVDEITQRYTLRRLAEVDPSTGRLFYGVQEAMVVQATSSPDAQVTLHCTLHEATDQLFVGSFDADKMNSARLTNLIDPQWVEQSTRAPNPQPRPSLAGGAVWDTRSTALDPGSMLDMGFRMVVFPAKEVSGDAVPDFDLPLDITQPIVLDPTKPNEPQFITVDYASGVIMLSHRPLTTDPLCEVAPNGIVGTGGNNPRGELVLFACFVPYSLEEGQLGASVRVTASASQEDFSTPISLPAQVDAFGDRPHFPVVVGQNVRSGQGCPTGVPRTLDIQDDLGQLPESGFFELLNADGTPVFTDGAVFPAVPTRTSTFGYGRKQHFSGTPGQGVTRLYGVYGGGVVGVSVTTTAGMYIVIRREALLTKTDPVVGEFPTIDFQQDVSYGSAKRATALRFPESTVEPQADGSVTIGPASAPVFNDIFRSWVLSGGRVTAHYAAANNSYVDIEQTEVLFKGRRYVLPPGRVGGNGQLLDATFYVIYADSSTPNLAYNYTTSMPLPRPDDIALAGYYTVAAPPPNLPNPVDLRNPLSKIDQRLDILVGDDTAGFWDSQGYVTPHFKTLSEAVAYVNGLALALSLGSTGTLPRICIRVTGGTNETPASPPPGFPSLPITIQYPGLIIEGSPQIAEVFSGTISWDTDEPLIDFGGMVDVVIRDLNFAYMNAAASTVAPTPSRYVFTNSAGSPRRIRIENCRAFGTPATSDGKINLEGFLYSDATGTWEDCTFVRNWMWASDFGFYIGDSSQAADCRFENNNLQGSGVPRLPSAIGMGIHVSFTGTGGTQNRNNQFKGNRIYGTLQTAGDYTGKTVGFRNGLYTYGRADTIEANIIKDTQLFGLIVASASHAVIHANVLDNVWTHVPFLAAKIPETTAGPDVPQPSYGGPSVTVNLTAPTAFQVDDLIYIQNSGYYKVLATPGGNSLTLRLHDIQGTTAYPVIAPTGTVLASTGLSVSLVAHRTGLWVSSGLTGVDDLKAVTIDSNSISLNVQHEFYEGISDHYGIYVSDAYTPVLTVPGPPAIITNNILVRGVSSGQTPFYGIRVFGNTGPGDEFGTIAKNFCGFLFPPQYSARVEGNHAAYILDGRLVITESTFTGNTIRAAIDGAGTSTFQGTAFQCESCTFTGNRVPTIALQGGWNSLQGNQGGNFYVEGTSNTISTSVVSQDLGILEVGPATTTIISGNHVGNDLLLVGPAQIMGNHALNSIDTVPPGGPPVPGTIMFGNVSPLYFGVPGPFPNPAAGDNI